MAPYQLISFPFDIAVLLFFLNAYVSKKSWLKCGAAVDAPAAPAPPPLFIYFHVERKTAGVSRFILPRIAHRECHRRRQSWVPCGFERWPFVREKHA